MGAIYFISGVDTDAGKTVVTGLMARYLQRRGVRVITVKLIQTGNPPGFSEDREKHRLMMGGISFPEDEEGLTAPQIFRFPSSPHLAASLEKRTVSVEAMRYAVKTASKRYEVTLVEGAGGLAVPLTENLLTIDFAREEKWKPILVTTGKLGSLNHAILSIEALTARKMKLAGTVYNEALDAPPEILADTFRMIKKYLELNGQKSFVVPIPKIDFNFLPDVDFSGIFEG